MKKLLTILLILCSYYLSYGQNEQIVLQKYPGTDSCDVLLKNSTKQAEVKLTPDGHLMLRDDYCGWVSPCGIVIPYEVDFINSDLKVYTIGVNTYYSLLINHNLNRNYVFFEVYNNVGENQAGAVDTGLVGDSIIDANNLIIKKWRSGITGTWHLIIK